MMSFSQKMLTAQCILLSDKLTHIRAMPCGHIHIYGACWLPADQLQPLWDLLCAQRQGAQWACCPWHASTSQCCCLQ